MKLMENSSFPRLAHTFQTEDQRRLWHKIRACNGVRKIFIRFKRLDEFHMDSGATGFRFYARRNGGCCGTWKTAFRSNFRSRWVRNFKMFIRNMKKIVENISKNRSKLFFRYHFP